MKVVNHALEIFSDPVKKMPSDQGMDHESEQYDGEKFVTMFSPFE
jgi:hypothetical protein